MSAPQTLIRLETVELEDMQIGERQPGALLVGRKGGHFEGAPNKRGASQTGKTILY